MVIVMQPERVEDIRITLTCTMTVAQWKVLAEQLGDDNASRDVRDFHDAVKVAADRMHFKIDNQAVIRDDR